MRETGPVRKALEGDAAAPYVGAARTLLGKLKADMRFNALSQGQRVEDLPDGTRIIATSMFGRDKISVVTAAGQVNVPPAEVIDVPYAPPPVPIDKATLEDLTAQGIAILCCGATSEFSDGIMSSYLWTPADGATPVEVPGAAEVYGQALSGNGQVAVGCYLSAAGDMFAFRWTAQGGGETLPVPRRGAGGDYRATGVSEDGSVVVGLAPTIVDGTLITGMWFWTRAGGVVFLEGGYFESQLTGDGPYISPNGNFIAGTKAAYDITYMVFPVGPSFEVRTGYVVTPKAALWVRNGPGVYGPGDELPTTGYTHTVQGEFVHPSFGYAPDNVYPLYWYPAGVSNNGAVCGWGPGGNSFDPRAGGGDATSAPLISFRWSEGKGLQELRAVGRPQRAAAITPDGGRIAGYTVTFESELSWVYTEGSGATQTEPGGLMDIGSSGTRYVGGGTGGAQRVFNFLQLAPRWSPAMLWANGGPVALPIPGAFTWAEAIGGTKLTISGDLDTPPKITAES